MKTCVFRFPSGFWGVRCRINSGEWILYSISCRNKQEAIYQARTAAYTMPSGRLYGVILPSEEDVHFTGVMSHLNPSVSWNKEYACKRLFNGRDIAKYNEAHKERPITMVKDYGVDGYIERIDLHDITDYSEAEVCFYDYYNIPPFEEAPYETGRPFTSWAKFVRRSFGFSIYHRVAYDC